MVRQRTRLVIAFVTIILILLVLALLVPVRPAETSSGNSLQCAYPGRSLAAPLLRGCH